MSSADDEYTKAEGNRRIIAAVFAFLSFGIAAWLLCLSISWSNAISGVLLQAATALSLSATGVLGMRALDGPMRSPGRTRLSSTKSEAENAVRLWIACFVAIEAAFLLATLMGTLYEYESRFNGDVCSAIYQPVVAEQADARPNAGFLLIKKSSWVQANRQRPVTEGCE